MMPIAFAPGAPYLEGPTALNTGSSSLTTGLVDKPDEVLVYPQIDAWIQKDSTSVQVMEGDVVAADIPGYPAPSIFSVTPDVCSIVDGHAGFVSAGTCEVRVRTHNVEFRHSFLAYKNSINAYALHHFEAGTFGYAVLEEVESLIFGKVSSAELKNRLSSHNNNLTAPDVVLNPSCIFNSYNHQATSVLVEGRSEDGFPGHLISPRHVVFANHVNPGTGKKIIFKKADGSYISATIVSGRDLYAYTGLGETQDIWIGFLDSNISGITPYRVLPSNLEDYVPSLYVSGANTNATLPCIILKKNNEFTGGSNWCVGNLVQHGGTATKGRSKESLRAWAPFSVCGGDSGWPVFIPVQGELILYMCFFTGSPNCAIQAGGGANPLHSVQSPINTAMNDLAAVAGDPLAGTYAAQTIDLSGFTSYP